MKLFQFTRMSRIYLAILLISAFPPFFCDTLDESLIPNPAFGRPMIHFTGFGQARKEHEFVEAHTSNPLAVRVFRFGRWIKDSCADEFSGFRYLSKKNLNSFFKDYKVCEYPFDNSINTDNFEIETKMICPTTDKQWVRVDCRFSDKSSPNSPPFFASRMSQKPGTLRSGSSKVSDFFGHAAGGKNFNERIRCDKQNTANELAECRALLGKFITLEKMMCDADNCNKPKQKEKNIKPEPEAAAKAEKDGTPQAEEEKKKEGEEEGISPLTIGLIAGGGVLAIGIGVAMMKYMGASKAADGAASTAHGAEGKHGGRRNGRGRRKNNPSATGSANEGLLEGNGAEIGEIEAEAEGGNVEEQA